jgi:acyl-CoA thioesterase-1
MNTLPNLTADSGGSGTRMMDFGFRRSLACRRILWCAVVLSMAWPFGAARGQPAKNEPPRESIEQMLAGLHLLSPLWKSGTVYRESVLFVADVDGQPATGKLTFRPEKILTVHSADGTRQFDAGKDFQLLPAGSELTLVDGSRIPYLQAADLFPAKGAERSILSKTGEPERAVLFDNGHWFHDRQIEVTYTHAPVVWPTVVPSFAEKQLPRTLAKLRDKQKLTLAVSGDSISQGYNASAFSGAPPWMPPYPDLVSAQLRKSYATEVVLHNRAIAGWNVASGLKDLDALLATQPDLIIIAYGMNDIGARDPESYRQGIATMLARIRQANAETEVILVATMLGNAEWVHTPRDMFPRYRDALASLAGPGVALADLTSLWQELLQRKREVDLTGNGVNHPSDFGHRLYAQVILTLLVQP